MACVLSVGCIVIWETIQDYKIQCIRDEMDREPTRKNVIKGVFRQHNEQFKLNGTKPPEGNA